MQTVNCSPLAGNRERGGVLIAIVLLLVPLVLIVSGYTSSMGGRMGRLQMEVEDERALLAAESGVDEVLFRARNGDLDESPFKRELGPDYVFTVEPTRLGADRIDNDGDHAIDEADEDVFQLIVTGTYRKTTRRIAAYLGRTSFMPPVDAAASIFKELGITLSGASVIDGRNYKLDGTRASSGSDRLGLAGGPGVAVSDILHELSTAERNAVRGVGSPSVGSTGAVDLAALVGEAQHSASHVVTWRDIPTDTSAAGIIFRNGDLSISGNLHARGLMVVTGKLRITGRFRFDGVIVVMGDVECAAGTMQIYGGLLIGPDACNLKMAGTADIRYSTEGVDLANRAAGRYVEFNGWQELPRR